MYMLLLWDELLQVHVHMVLMIQKLVDIDSVTTTIEPGKTVKFEIRIIPDADLG